ncbi:MAG: hypothetical protein RIK87_07455 [Fuerstiella sp.]
MFLFASSVFAGDQVDAIVDAWKARQKQFRAVGFHISGTLLETAGFGMAPTTGYTKVMPAPAEDETSGMTGTVVLDLERGRLRRHQVKSRRMWIPASKSFQSFPWDQLVVFNGSRFKSYAPHALNLAKAPVPGLKGIELNIAAADQPLGIVFDVEYDPLLYACGIIHTQLAFHPSDLQPRIDVRQFKSDGMTRLDEHDCVVLRTVPDELEHHFEYWVDAEDHRIIRQAIGYGLAEPGKLWLRTTIDYVETEHGPMPDIWIIERHDFQTDRLAVYSMKLDKFEANPAVSDADFDIDPPPGTRVTDSTRPRDAQHYVVGEAGQPDLPLREFALQQEHSRSRFRMYAGVLGLLVLLAVAVFVFRRQRGT